MSGGPIFFDGMRGVAGIICTGLDPGYATGAMIWPAMGIPVKYGEAVFESMLTFAQQGYVEVLDGLEHVSVATEAEGTAQVRFRRP